MDNKQNRIREEKNSQVQILLLGCNFCKEDKYDLSDSIIVASVDRKTGSVKLASIMRDIMVDLPEYGKNKINAALVYGGPDYTVQVVNRLFHLHIRNYVLVDMYGLVNIIDLLGGIDVEITEMERIFLNCWVRDLAMQFKDGIYPPFIEKSGMVHMDGRTALSHARNRTIGTDFNRTARQRVVLKAMAKKIQEESSPKKLTELFIRGWKYIKTNLSFPQMAALGLSVLKGKKSDFPSIRIPVDNTYKVCSEKQWYLEINFEENTKELEKFFAC